MEKENNEPFPWNFIPDGNCDPRRIMWNPFILPRVVQGEIKIREYKDDAGNKMQGVVVNAKEQK